MIMETECKYERYFIDRSTECIQWPKGSSVFLFYLSGSCLSRSAFLTLV